MHNNITGIILAGGESSRMGTNKSFLMMDGEFLIVRTLNLMTSLFSKVLVSTNSPEEYSALNVETISDVFTNSGPLAGIHSGLIHSPTENSFFISCDMPLMTAEIIQFIVSYPSPLKIKVVSLRGQIEPLCGVYSKRLLPVIGAKLQESIAGGKIPGVMNIIRSEAAAIIDIEKEFSGVDRNAFLNINRPEDFENLTRRQYKIADSHE